MIDSKDVFKRNVSVHKSAITLLSKTMKLKLERSNSVTKKTSRCSKRKLQTKRDKLMMLLPNLITKTP